MTSRSRGALVAQVIVLGLAGGTVAQAHDGEPPEPFSRTALDLTGDTIAGVAIASRHPAAVVVGVTYKAIDLAHDLGAAAIGREDRWLGAELVLVDRDAMLLKQMKHDGIALDGPEAAELRRRILDRMSQLTASDRSPAGYTASVIIKNLPYAVVKVGLGKLLENVVDFTLTKVIAPRLPVQKAINWALTYGGPLEPLRRGLGWAKLMTREGWAHKAAEDAMRDADKKLVSQRIKQLGIETRAETTADALSAIYKRIMMEHPSQARTVVASSFRLEVVRQAVMRPEPIMRAARPEPIMRAARPEPIMRAAAPVVIRTVEPDLVIRAIRAEDAVWDRAPRESSSSAGAASEPPARPAEPEVDPRAEARRQALHDELMRVGDGKTFTVCSNGCPSSGASWDGRRGQTLESR
jgi:hypothetical protein